MILPVNCYINRGYTSKISNKNNVSFSQNINNEDIYNHEYNEEIEILEYSPNDIHLIGSLDEKNYNIRFTRKDPFKKKEIEIKGYYDGQRVDVKATYKDNKHHYFSGKIGNKSFDIKHRIGGLFVKDNLQGKINNKDFYAKFPSASATDENRDLILLLMHFSGYTLPIDGYNFGSPEASNTSYSYYSGNIKDNIDSYTLLDDIWKDPVLPGPNPFNQVWAILFKLNFQLQL